MQCATIFGNNVIVDLSYYAGQKIVYFPVDGQLNEEFAKANKLLRMKDEAGNQIGGYLDPVKRNITALKLRGECSDGLVLPIECLSPYVDIDTLHIGDRISVLNGTTICQKYVPRRNPPKCNSKCNSGSKRKAPLAPLFAEHIDTAQLAYNHQAFHNGDIVEVTLKMHGTSQRTGYLPVRTGYKRTFIDRILRRKATPIYEYRYISGTRRTVLEDYDGGYYGSNAFRETHSKLFEGKLNKGETVYYEVVGFTDTGAPIMPSVNNKKMNDKEFVKQYGKETVFSYGCSPDADKKSEIYVYRMTLTNEDGFVVDYSPAQIRYRCEQIGVNVVPQFGVCIIPEDVDAGDYITEYAENFYDGVDPVGKKHIREGVVCRILNRFSFAAYKHKNFSFKVLSGIVSNTISDAQSDSMNEDLLGEI